jgi:predicted AAA+ superfamily ATPase
MVARTGLQATIQNTLDRSRVVALIGPRQCGKTTMARLFVPSDSINYFDLEAPLSLTRLDQPMTALQDLRGLVVIDEVERRPDPFPIVRVLVDRIPLPARFQVFDRIRSNLPEIPEKDVEKDIDQAIDAGRNSEV